MATQTTLQKRESILDIAKRVDALAIENAASFEAAARGEAGFADQLAIACVMNDMRSLLTEEAMQPVMALMNNSLGFLTDKDPSRPDRDGKLQAPYGWETVRDVVLEARIRGFNVVGNEMNIIAGKFYPAKAGLARKVTKHPEVTDFEDVYDPPRLNTGGDGALVKCRATWKRGGVAHSIELDVPVKVNRAMGADAIQGKAERKLLARVWKRLTGAQTPDGEVGDAVDVQSVVVETKAEEVKPQTEAAKAPPKADEGPALTPQERLADIVLKEGFSFDEFVAWGKASGNVPEPDSIPCFAEVPTEVAVRLLRATKGLLQQLKAAKGGDK